MMSLSFFGNSNFPENPLHMKNADSPIDWTESGMVNVPTNLVHFANVFDKMAFKLFERISD